MSTATVAPFDRKMRHLLGEITTMRRTLATVEEDLLAISRQYQRMDARARGAESTIPREELATHHGPGRHNGATATLVEILRAADHPMTAAELREALHARGVVASPHALFMYLRSARAQRSGQAPRSTWSLPKGAPPS